MSKVNFFVLKNKIGQFLILKVKILVSRNKIVNNFLFLCHNFWFQEQNLSILDFKVKIYVLKNQICQFLISKIKNCQFLIFNVTNLVLRNIIVNILDFKNKIGQFWI